MATPLAAQDSLGPPPIDFGGRLWATDELSGIAAAWVEALRDRVPPDAPLAGVVLANHPEAVALFFALSTFPVPLVVLPPEPRAWRSDPPIPIGTPIFLAPGQRRLAGDVVGMGLQPHAVLEPARLASTRASGAAAFLRAPGFVLFTSGSTGRPKPVYVATRSFLHQATVTAETYGLSIRTGVAASLPLASHFGMGHALILPGLLGARLGLLPQFTPRGLLNLFRTGTYDYWAGTPLMADLVSRVPHSGPPLRGPETCHVSAGPLTERVFRTFRDRFGVPLRPSYGRTENGFITVENAPAAAVRPEAVGRQAPGIEIRIGDDPRHPRAPGSLGRVWFRSPWYMEGYGFPPNVRRDGTDGWWSTEDIGCLDERGYLILAGRVDECFKTPSGYLVNPAEIARALATHPAVREVLILPVPGPGAPVIGAVVLVSQPVEPGQLRDIVAPLLPSWLWPEVLIVTTELPRLPGGKPDRDACAVLLHAARGSSSDVAERTRS